MRTSGVPQLQVIRMECLYCYKSHITHDRRFYHCFTGGRIWASVGRAGIRKSHTTLGEIVGLHNCAVADKGPIDKARIKESHTTLGEIVGLHNCAVADITPQRERMITYDVT